MEYTFQSVNLTKKYGTMFALKDVNIHIPKGSIYGLVGPNGAGKSTLMSIILGATLPTAGYVAINGVTEIEDLNLQRKKIGSIMDVPTLYPTMSAIDNLISRCKLLGIKDFVEKSKEMLAYVGLEDAEKKKVKNFSLGMKQRLAIGLALLGDPEILVLDEPTNGLDPIGVHEIRNIIQKLNQQGVTILISSHILAELSKFATHYGILYRGKLMKEIDEAEVMRNLSDALRISFNDEKEANNAFNLLSAEFGAETLKKVSPKIIKIRFNERIISSMEVTKILMDNNIVFVGISVEQDGFEDYFLKLINGRG